MTSLHSRIRHALLADPNEAIGSRLSGDDISAAVERIVMTVRSPGPSPLAAGVSASDPKGASPSGRGQPSPVDAWFAAHDAYHQASDAYNNRLALVRAERERDNWTMTTDKEYHALGDAQKEAHAADELLYRAIRALKSDGGSPPQPDPRDAMIARMREALRDFVSWRDKVQDDEPGVGVDYLNGDGPGDAWDDLDALAAKARGVIADALDPADKDAQ